MKQHVQKVVTPCEVTNLPSPNVEYPLKNTLFFVANCFRDPTTEAIYCSNSWTYQKFFITYKKMREVFLKLIVFFKLQNRYLHSDVMLSSYSAPFYIPEVCIIPIKTACQVFVEKLLVKAKSSLYV